MGLTHNESYLLERQKLEFQERKEVRKREREKEQHKEVMAKIELEIAKLRNGRTFFSG